MERKPFICTVGVGVFGVINANGVILDSMIVSISGSTVGELKTMSVGVGVKVTVGGIGVAVGGGVCVSVLVGTASADGPKNCPKAQEINRTAMRAMIRIFFMVFGVWELDIQLME
jgi:hypothetical protein